MEVKEAEHLPESMWTSYEKIISTPRFSAERSVVPETLTGPTTFQDITVTFRLEEPLPSEVTSLDIIMGNVNLAYQQYRLVETRFVSQDPVDGWSTWNDGTRAYWVNINPHSLELGKTYTFHAVLEADKSPDLLGSPIAKPYVQINYARWRNPAPVYDSSVQLMFSDTMQATFYSKDAVMWYPAMSDHRYDFGFNQVVSEITPPPPPFHVLIPADVRIEPETLNLKSEGVFTAFIRLPEQYNVNDIDLTTVTSEGASAIKGVIDGDTLILKFRRQDLQNVESGEEIELTVSGVLKDGSVFEGSDIIRVIE